MSSLYDYDTFLSHLFELESALAGIGLRDCQDLKANTQVKARQSSSLLDIVQAPQAAESRDRTVNFNEAPPPYDGREFTQLRLSVPAGVSVHTMEPGRLHPKRPRVGS